MEPLIVRWVVRAPSLGQELQAEDSAAEVQFLVTMSRLYKPTRVVVRPELEDKLQVQTAQAVGVVTEMEEMDHPVVVEEEMEQQVEQEPLMEELQGQEEI